MASNGSIVEDVIKFSQNAKQHLVEITPENAKEILHDEEQEQQQEEQKDAEKRERARIAAFASARHH
jgi:hypothetical protein